MRIKHSIKILTLSLLAAVAVMAVSASGAQANWSLLEGAGKTSVGDLTLAASVGPVELLVPLVGLEIYCEKGSGSALAVDGTPMAVATTIVFVQCNDLSFGEVCDVRGVGDPSGSKQITAAASGTGSMTTATNLFVTITSTAGAPFANFVYEGPECPLTEFNGEVTGSLKVEVKEPCVHKATHEFEVIEDNLSFGGNQADLHNGALGNVKGTLTRAGGIAVSVCLTGL